MGLDITIREYKGKDERGYLMMYSPEKELPYSTDRRTIRHEILKNIDVEVLSSGKIWDMEEYYRPSNFEKAYEWCNSLNESDKDYVEKLLDSLMMNKNYYLNYSY